MDLKYLQMQIKLSMSIYNFQHYDYLIATISSSF